MEVAPPVDPLDPGRPVVTQEGWGKARAATRDAMVLSTGRSARETLPVRVEGVGGERGGGRRCGKRASGVGEKRGREDRGRVRRRGEEKKWPSKGWKEGRETFCGVLFLRKKSRKEGFKINLVKCE